MRINISENGFKCILNSYEAYWYVRDTNLMESINEFILELFDMSSCLKGCMIEESSGKEIASMSYDRPESLLDFKCELNDKNIEWIKINTPEKSQFGSHRDNFQFWGSLLEDWGNEYVQG